MRTIYIAISIIVLAVIAIIAIYIRKKSQKPLSKLETFAFLLVILGMFFGENRLVGYSFIGIGVLLCVIDIIKGLKK